MPWSAGNIMHTTCLQPLFYHSWHFHHLPRTTPHSTGLSWICIVIFAILCNLKVDGTSDISWAIVCIPIVVFALLWLSVFSYVLTMYSMSVCVLQVQRVVEETWPIITTELMHPSVFYIARSTWGLRFILRSIFSLPCVAHPLTKRSDRVGPDAPAVVLHLGHWSAPARWNSFFDRVGKGSRDFDIYSYRSYGFGQAADPYPLRGRLGSRFQQVFWTISVYWGSSMFTPREKNNWWYVAPFLWVLLFSNSRRSADGKYY